jgi:hypothetical protein
VNPMRPVPTSRYNGLLVAGYFPRVVRQAVFCQKCLEGRMTDNTKTMHDYPNCRDCAGTAVEPCPRSEL